jgi:hypothetical protein
MKLQLELQAPSLDLFQAPHELLWELCERIVKELSSKILLKVLSFSFIIRWLQFVQTTNSP